MTQEINRCSVVVVGGGISGLCAAKLLNENGVDAVVLEASDRVGGRVHTVYNDKVGWVDLGAAYVGPTQNRIFRIAKELGLKTNLVYSKTDMLCVRKGVSKRFQGVLPPMPGICSILDANNLLRNLHNLGDKVNLEQPWATPGASHLDNMTLQEWLNNTVSESVVMDDIKMIARANFATEPYEVSLLWALWYIKSCGGVLRMNANDGGAQERTFIGGAQQLPIRLAAKLEGKVFCNKPVCRIQYESLKVVAHTLDGDVYECDYVIMATPPAAQLKILFQPPLPALRNQLLHKVPLGSVIKTFTYYPKAYWIEKGTCGTTFIEDDDIEYPIVASIDDTKPDGSHPCLMGFLVAEKARLLCSLSKEERMTRIARQYAKMFDCPDLMTPMHYEEKNWCEDQWAGGCYTGFTPPGVLTMYGQAIRKQIGRIHFAGTESATQWSGYMEGAIQAGERAAREILYEMDKCKKSDIDIDEPPDQDIPDIGFRLSFLQTHLPSKGGFLKSAAVLGAAAAAAAVAGVYSRL